MTVPKTGELFGDQPTTKFSRGYAGDPGRGPAGETCGSCRHCVAQGGTAKTYYKCAIGRVTRSQATDIRLRTPACQHWEGE